MHSNSNESSIILIFDTATDAVPQHLITSLSVRPHPRPALKPIAEAIMHPSTA